MVGGRVGSSMMLVRLLVVGEHVPSELTRWAVDELTQ
jgi:hypothetical protein